MGIDADIDQPTAEQAGRPLKRTRGGRRANYAAAPARDATQSESEAAPRKLLRDAGGHPVLATTRPAAASAAGRGRSTFADVAAGKRRPPAKRTVLQTVGTRTGQPVAADAAAWFAYLEADAHTVSVYAALPPGSQEAAGADPLPYAAGAAQPNHPQAGAAPAAVPAWRPGPYATETPLSAECHTRLFQWVADSRAEADAAVEAFHAYAKRADVTGVATAQPMREALAAAAELAESPGLIVKPIWEPVADGRGGTARYRRVERWRANYWPILVLEGLRAADLAPRSVSVVVGPKGQPQLAIVPAPGLWAETKQRLQASQLTVIGEDTPPDAESWALEVDAGPLPPETTPADGGRRAVGGVHHLALVGTLAKERLCRLASMGEVQEPRWAPAGTEVQDGCKWLAPFEAPDDWLGSGQLPVLEPDGAAAAASVAARRHATAELMELWEKGVAITMPGGRLTYTIRLVRVRRQASTVTADLPPTASAAAPVTPQSPTGGAAELAGEATTEDAADDGPPGLIPEAAAGSDSDGTAAAAAYVRAMEPMRPTAADSVEPPAARRPADRGPRADAHSAAATAATSTDYEGRHRGAAATAAGPAVSGRPAAGSPDTDGSRTSGSDSETSAGQAHPKRGTLRRTAGAWDPTSQRVVQPGPPAAAGSRTGSLLPH